MEVAISRLNRDLEQQFTAWRERRLQEHGRVLYLDGIHGLLAAVNTLFSATPRPRCLLHKQRNVLPRCPRWIRQDIEAELQGI